MNKKLTTILTMIVLAMGLSTAMAASKAATQTGIGTIDMFSSHGKQLYRFVPKEPNEKKLRKVKMQTSRMGYKKGLPKERLSNNLSVKVADDFLLKAGLVIIC